MKKGFCSKNKNGYTKDLFTIDEIKGLKTMKRNNKALYTQRAMLLNNKLKSDKLNLVKSESVMSEKVRVCNNRGYKLRDIISPINKNYLLFNTPLITNPNRNACPSSLLLNNLNNLNNKLMSLKRGLNSIKSMVTSISNSRYASTFISPCLSLVPYGSNIISIPLSDILLGNNSSLILSREIPLEQVISLLRSKTTGFYLMTVSTKAGSLTNMMVSLSNEFNAQLVSSRKLDEKDLKGIKSIHNMIYIPSAELIIPWNATKSQTNKINNIKIYPVHLVCSILSIQLELSISELKSSLNTYSRLLKEARERNMKPSIIEKLIEKLSLKESLLSFLSRSLNNLNNLNNLSIWSELKVKDLNISVAKLTKDIKSSDLELVSIMSEINNKAKTVNTNYPFTSSTNEFKYNGLSLGDFVKKNFGSIIKSEAVNSSEEEILEPKLIPGIFNELSNLNLNEATPYQIRDLVHLIETLYRIINSIGWKEGFINDFDFTDSETYPLLNLVIPNVLDYNYGIKAGQPNASEIVEKRLADPLKFYREDISKKWPVYRFGMFYNTLINLIVLHLYTLISSCVVRMENNSNLFNLSYYPLLGRAEALSRLLWGLMSLDIRDSLTYKNPKINQVIFAGFDTEYQELDTAKVKPLSGQVANYSELHIELPIRTPYNPEGIVTNTGEKYMKVVIPSQGIDRHFVISSMNESINYLMNLIHGEKLNDIKILRDKLLNIPKDSIINFEVLKTENKEIYIWRQALIDTEFIDLYNRVVPWNLENLILDHIIPSSQNNLQVYTDNLKVVMNEVDIKKAEPIVMNEEDINEAEPIEKDLENTNYNKWESFKDFEILHRTNLTIPKEIKKPTEIKKPSWIKLRNLRVRIGREINIFSHYNAADLSLFSNWEEHKRSIKILNKSYVSFGRGKKIGGWNVKWRDTILLSSASASSLKELGQMHNLKKGELTQSEKENMESLFNTNLPRFKEYALQDAVISLRHGISILDFLRNTIGVNKVPVTLSSLAQLVIKQHWKDSNYKGYQIDPEYQYDPQFESGTPKGINAQGNAGLMMPLYLASARGGRNESMMYGKDLESTWYDWDLNGCYTTIMSGMGNPVYSKTRVITQEDKLDLDEISNKSFSVMCVKFKFPSSVKYPVLPVQVDKTITCYPKEGTSICTGSEYVLANKLGAKMTIISGCVIPFETKEEENNGKTELVLINLPFFSFVEKVQYMRKLYPKKSAPERMWKDIGNMGYGQCFQGLSGRKALDTATGTHQFIPPSSLTNPIIASWITGKARSVVGESMNNLHKLNPKNKIVSVTTDGFLTNVPNLEETLLKDYSKEKRTLKESLSIGKIDNSNLKWFKECRVKLGHTGEKANAYELKGSVKGIFSWRTRGQLGVSPINEIPGKEIILSAMTGYQKKNRTLKELSIMLDKGLSTDMKLLNFFQFRLRGANDIFKKGGNVTSVFTEKRFRVGFDNKRKIMPGEIERFIETEHLRKAKPSINIPKQINQDGVSYIDLVDYNNLMDTEPWENGEKCKLSRSIMGRLKTQIFKSNDYTLFVLPRMFSRSEVFIRSLMYYYLHRDINNDPLIPMIKDDLKFVEFIGKVMNEIGNKVKINASFVRNWLRHLAVLRFKGWYSPQLFLQTYYATPYLSKTWEVINSIETYSIETYNIKTSYSSSNSSKSTSIIPYSKSTSIIPYYKSTSIIPYYKSTSIIPYSKSSSSSNINSVKGNNKIIIIIIIIFFIFIFF